MILIHELILVLKDLRQTRFIILPSKRVIGANSEVIIAISIN